MQQNSSAQRSDANNNVLQPKVSEKTLRDSENELSIFQVQSGGGGGSRGQAQPPPFPPLLGSADGCPGQRLGSATSVRCPPHSSSCTPPEPLCGAGDSTLCQNSTDWWLRNNRNLCLTVPEAGKSEIMSGGNRPPRETSSGYPSLGWKALFMRSLMPFRRVPLS